MKYQALFSISFLHNYFVETGNYVPEITKYLTLTPTPECLDLVKRYRLKLHQKPGKWYVHTPVLEDNTTFLPHEPLRFQFYLKVDNPDFFYFTYFSENFLKRKYKENGMPLFHSTENSTQLSDNWYQHWVTDRFEIKEERTVEDNYFLQNQPVAPLTSENSILEGLGEPSPNFIYDPILNKISLDTTSNSYTDGQIFFLKYEAIPAWASQTFGLIEIKVDGNNFSFEKDYTYSFSRKKKKWNYLIISPDTYNPQDLVIENGNTGLLFNPTEELLDGEHFVRLKSAFPSSRIFRISSTGAIPFKKNIRTGIKLKKEGELLIKDLPNPSPASQGIEIINIYS